METYSANRPYQYKNFVRVISAFSILVGILVLIGYQFNITLFISITPFWLNMKANTAICLILSGIALWTLKDENLTSLQMLLIKFVACVLIIFSTVTIIENFLGINFHIDQILYTEQAHIEDIIYPGRTSIATSLCLLFLGLAFYFNDKKSNNEFITQISILITLSIAFFGLLGYFYNINTVYGITYFTKMALHTSIIFILLCVGVLLSRPQRGIVGLLISDTVGGWSLRTLLPLMITIPLIIGFLENLGEKLDLYSPPFGDNLQITSTIIVLALIVIHHASKLNQLFLQKKAKIEN